MENERSKHSISILKKGLAICSFLFFSTQLFSQTANEIKSSFINMLANNVQWNNLNSRNFTIGIMEKDSSLYRQMRDSVTGKPIHAKPTRIRYFLNASSINNVSVLFVDKDIKANFDNINKAIQGKGILLITDSLDANAMINFEIIGQSIRFNIDQAAINAENMTVSKELLEYHEKQATQNWQHLFGVTHKLLEDERLKLQKLTAEINQLEENIGLLTSTNNQLIEDNKQKEELAEELSKRIEAQKTDLKTQSIELEDQNRKLNSLYQNISTKQQRLNHVLDSLNSYKSEIQNLSEKEKQFRSNISNLQSETEKYLTEIEHQKGRLKLQLSKIESQRLTIWISILSLCIFSILAIIAFRAYRSKRKALKLLEVRNIAISKQKEEIEAQRIKLEQANEKLLQLDKFKEGMTGMIVHDLKNPLNGIINIPKSDTPARQVSRMQRIGKQMLNMVLNILDVYKYEETKMIVAMSNCSLYELSESAFQEVNFLAEQKNIHIINSIEKYTGIHADKEITKRIFINILTNAIKYTPNNGDILMKAFAEEHNDNGFIRIEITDTGQGIPEEQLSQVFEKFSQIDAKESGKIRSTGLGLTFCKIAVEAHSGMIGVDSKMGAGSTFWFTLPASSVSIEKENQQRNKSENITQKELSSLLSPNDKQHLSLIAKQLNRCEIYDISILRKILKQVDSIESASIQQWKEELKMAIQSGNEKTYKELIKVIYEA